MHGPLNALPFTAATAYIAAAVVHSWCDLFCSDMRCARLLVFDSLFRICVTVASIFAPCLTPVVRVFGGDFTQSHWPHCVAWVKNICEHVQLNFSYFASELIY